MSILRSPTLPNCSLPPTIDGIGVRSDDPFDVVRDLAVPVPVTIIAEMLGVPGERVDDFKRWSDLVIEFTTGSGRRNQFSPRFADSFVELLAYVKGLTKLEVLNLDNQATDSVLAHLRELRNLRSLSLNWCKAVTDDGLEHLEGLTNLRTLSLGSTQVTDEGVKRLQQALPDCEIKH